MILAKNRLMGPTLETARTTTIPESLRGRMERTATGSAVSGVMEITMRVPMAKGLELMKMLREAGRSSDATLVLRAGPTGEVDITVQGAEGMESATTSSPAPTLNERERLVKGELEINPGRHEVIFRGKRVPQLTYTEFGILHFLALHPGWVYSREQIVEGVKGKDYPVTDRAVDVQVAGLRKKLGAAADLVETVRGVGYRFTDR